MARRRPALLALSTTGARDSGPASKERMGDSSSPGVPIVPSGTGLGLNICLASTQFYHMLYFLPTIFSYQENNVHNYIFVFESDVRSSALE